MKHLNSQSNQRSLVQLIAALLLALPALAVGQNYSNNWFTVDGGGGTRTNGQYSLSGTIGQHDAGQMSGGQFTLSGGYWALPSVAPDSGTPILMIVPDIPGHARISWDPATPGFVLQYSPTLNPSAWTNAPGGATNPVVVPATSPVQFFRLIK